MPMSLLRTGRPIGIREWIAMPADRGTFAAVEKRGVQ